MSTAPVSDAPVNDAPVTYTYSLTLADHVVGQLLRLGSVAGLPAAESALYAHVVLESLGDVPGRSLALPAPSPSFISDDHTPVEFSLSFRPDAPPGLRVLVEPGCGAGDMADNGRQGLAAIRDMARRWDFSTAQLDRLEDLFLPSSPQGPLALWYALELRPGGVPGVKIYLSPDAAGPQRAAATVREALHRLGHRQAFTALPDTTGYPFLALDLGAWETPRVKVYTAHPHLAASEAYALSRAQPGPARADVEAFFHLAAEGRLPTRTGGRSTVRLARRPALTCHSFTDTATGRPSGFTLHIPVRDYVNDDEEALARATAALTHFGMDPSVLRRALAALTTRQLSDGVGLIAYLALACERDRGSRVTTYLSSEAYSVRPPKQ
ncbi:tryptophan dimethylallyltransferase family protein [Streptomyces sp. DT2A-34]|uniref:tryptophan dimethylallyltransferase family protein n=1 Tax=Streptomyces sp. DT2A-34 TaxID=3051182 RepID=UPI00265C5FE4|nr:tryptophan dimethylallyltransferase family protein [Streptomyces sp. DT2A-34]MDO0915331.1 tryptophan dimethylallyltransferase family protein [Streptomyces sp. DT2A-34]